MKRRFRCDTCKKLLNHTIFGSNLEIVKEGDYTREPVPKCKLCGSSIFSKSMIRGGLMTK